MPKKKVAIKKEIKNEKDEVSLYDAPENKQVAIESALEKKIKEEFPDRPLLVNQLKRISYYLSKVGLKVLEACSLVNMTDRELKEILRKSPTVKTIIQRKELEFKKDLMTSLSKRARSGDDKLALELLTVKYPEEFGKRKKGGGDGNDIMEDALLFIQQSGDSSSLVAARRTLSPGSDPNAPSNPKNVIKKVEDVLT